jgi:hypothetical protein
MRIARTRSSIETAPREIKEIAAEVARRVGHQPIAMGLLTVYLPHTSAALLIQENASPDVLGDLVPRHPPARWSCRSSARRHHGRLRRGFCLSLVDGKMLRKGCFQGIERPHTRG